MSHSSPACEGKITANKQIDSEGREGMEKMGTPVMGQLALAPFQRNISSHLPKTQSCCLYGSLWKPMADVMDGLAESSPGQCEVASPSC